MLFVSNIIAMAARMSRVIILFGMVCYLEEYCIVFMYEMSGKVN